MRDEARRTIEKILKDFYREAFEIDYVPNIEIEDGLLSEKPPFLQIYFNLETGEIIVSQDFLDYFGYSSTVVNLDEILLMQSLLIDSALLQIFHKNKNNKKSYNLGYELGMEIFANNLGAIYLSLGKLYSNENNRIKIKNYIIDKTGNPYLVPIILNTYITRDIRDGRELKDVENVLKDSYIIEVSFVMKEVGIYRFLKDLKKTLSNPERADEILEEYGYGFYFYYNDKRINRGINKKRYWKS